MEKLSGRWMYYSGMLAMMCPSVKVDDLKHIQDLIDAEEQGLLLRLPCAIGSTVYAVRNYLDCKYDYNCPLGYSGGKYNCEKGYWCQHEHRKFVISEIKFDIKMFSEIGKTVFLTREEAEAALEKMKGEEHEQI